MARTLALLIGLWTCGRAVRVPRRRESNQTTGDDCIMCLQSGEESGCDSRCAGKSVECQSCVHFGGKADCVAQCFDGEGTDGTGEADTHGGDSLIEVDGNLTTSDDCTSCLQFGGGSACLGRCSGKSQDCRNCVSFGGGAGCISRCSGGGGGGVGPINWNDWNAKVSTYFTVGEVCRYDTRRIPRSASIKNAIVSFAAELDKVRAAWGSGIAINSWYRPPDVNREVGGVSNSQHIQGSAADIRPTNGNTNGLQSWLDGGLWSNRALGYGASRGFVHIDMRSGRIRWNYR